MDFADESTPPRGEITQARIRIDALEQQASRVSKLWVLITVAATLLGAGFAGAVYWDKKANADDVAKIAAKQAEQSEQISVEKATHAEESARLNRIEQKVDELIEWTIDGRHGRQGHGR